MKNIKYIALLFISVGFLSSCELDEMEGPDAGLYGSIIDVKTGELVEQDIIRGGELELREAGFKNVTPQFMNYKVDGTFKDSKLFGSMYKVLPIRTNFQPIDTLEVNINGQTQLDLEVTPYLRIKNPVITKSGTIVTATFGVEQTGLGNVSKIGLYAGADANVGEPTRLVRAEQTINERVAPLKPSVIYSISIDISKEQDLTGGKLYFFRIGALYDVPNARFNYAKAVEVQL